MADLGMSGMNNLHTAGTAIADNLIGTALLDSVEELLANLHGNLILFFLEAVATGHAAAASIGVLDLNSNHVLEHLVGWQADCLRTQMTRCMIDIFLIFLANEVMGKLALFFEDFQIFKSVIDVLCGVNHILLAEELRIFLLEHERAAGAARNNRVALGLPVLDALYILVACSSASSR